MYKHQTETRGYEAQSPVPQETDEWQDEHQSAAIGTGRRRELNPRAGLFIRRLIGLAIAVGLAYGIFHVVFRTDVLAPVLAYAEPVRNGIDWVLADPTRAWGALAAIVIPHIGAYYMLFEDRK